MAFNQISRTDPKSFEFASQWKDVEHSDSQRPHGKFLAAPWLPALYYDEHARENIILPVGKGVKLDASGHLVPGGLVDGDDIQYSAWDVGKTYNVATGALVAAAATVTIPTGQIPTRSRPIGVVAHNVFQLSAGVTSTSVAAYWTYAVDYKNPINFRAYNYPGTDALVTVLCDYVIRVPYLKGVDTTVDTNVAGFAYQLGTIQAGALDNFLTGDPLSSQARAITHAHDFSVDGDVITSALVAGSFVKVDTAGNFMPWTPQVIAIAGGPDPLTLDDASGDKIGQVLWIENYLDQSALNRVRTPGFGQAGFAATQGRATYGVDKAYWLCTDGAQASVEGGTALSAGVVNGLMVAINLLR